AGKSLTWSSSAVNATLAVTSTNNVGATGGATTITLTGDTTAPSIATLVPASGTTSQTSTTFIVTWTEIESGSGVAARGLQRQSADATSSRQCATATYVNDGPAQGR